MRVHCWGADTPDFGNSQIHQSWLTFTMPWSDHENRRMRDGLVFTTLSLLLTPVPLAQASKIRRPWSGSSR